MTALLNRISAEDAESVRAFLRDENAQAEDLTEAGHGIFGPIEYAAASGRSHCRECGAKIEKGERCVRFQLDMYRARFGRWGHTVSAWIHDQCPDQEGAS